MKKLADLIAFLALAFLVLSYLGAFETSKPYTADDIERFRVQWNETYGATFDERFQPMKASGDEWECITDTECEDEEVGRERYEDELREALERKAQTLRSE